MATGALINPAWAGPPFNTDDPEPVQYQHWEVNYAVNKTWRQTTTSSGNPIVDINYGIAPDVQLHAQPTYAYEKKATYTRAAFDDTEVGIKYRFINVEQGDSTIMVGIYPNWMLPSGDKMLGANRGRNRILIPLWVQRNSEKWTIYGGAGYRINPGSGNQNSVYTGGAALYQVTPSLQLGGEMFHETPTSVGGLSVLGVNLGGIYNLAKDYSLLFSAGRGLQNVFNNQLSIYSALQVHY